MKARLSILSLISILILLPLFVFSQQTSNTEFDIIITNWTHFQEQGNYTRAVEQAKLAFSFAEKINKRDLLAIALNLEGRSLLKLTKRLSKNRKEAKKKFKQSLLYLTDINKTDLRLDNLENLKWLAEKDNDQQLATFYQRQIEEVKVLLETNANNETLAGKFDSLRLKEVMLFSKIDYLTDVQIKAELLIALQKNQVDAFAFARIKDSLLLAQKEMTLFEQVAIMDLQDSKIALQKSQGNLLLALAAIIGFLAIGLVIRYRETKKHNTLLETKNTIIEEQQKQSNELLLNILPAPVAKELSLNGVAKAKKFEIATVFFSDFINFSRIAQLLSPEELVHELDFHFKAFDNIIGKYKLEKIKTIGDAYMCVGGLPEEHPGHAKEMVLAALEIQAFLKSLKMEREKKGQVFFEARIGIHTGPLVAGVVGSKKFAYDVWGDTVNVAARLESNGYAEKVNISATTYALLKSEFNCENRGLIAIKNLGNLEMYFVNGQI
jgi:adenylate cyclase